MPLYMNFTRSYLKQKEKKNTLRLYCTFQMSNDIFGLAVGRENYKEETNKHPVCKKCGLV